tara:strand:+ start:305 stop:625 length:321 start_codon:yes stop_codon:yes gene_type:complete
MPNQRFQKMLDTIDAQLTSKDNLVIRWAKLKQVEDLLKKRMLELRANIIETGDTAFHVKYVDESDTMPKASVLFDALTKAIGKHKAEIFYEENKGTKSGYYVIRLK